MSFVPTALFERIKASNQDHLFPYFEAAEKLGDDEKNALVKDLESVHWEDLERLYQLTIAPPSHPVDINPPSLLGQNTNNNPAVTAILDQQELEVVQGWEERGFQSLGKSECAVVIMGGGQGTRLGYDGPKGSYAIGPLTGASLFELFVQRVIRLRQLCVRGEFAPSVPAVRIPIVVMTSGETDAPTRAFFEEKEYFGYPKADVIFFQQEMVPCFDNHGKVMMKSFTGLAKNPNGNGGIFSSMKRTGTLDELQKRGVKYVHIHGIDNVLTKVLDPIFIGYCLSENAEVGNKCCTKTSADEKVGVFASFLDSNGKRVPTVVEYTELPKEMADQTNASGAFVYGAGNICNHFFTLAFITRLVDAAFLESNASSLHAAYKKISHINVAGESISPESANGVKMEMFIFDSFWMASKVAGLEVPRAEEFAPVKNASGADSPETARRLLSNLHAKWLKNAGAVIDEKSFGHYELSPLVSYAGEGLDRFGGMKMEHKPILKNL